MMAPNFSLQYMDLGDSCSVQRIPIDQTFLTFLMKGITIYKTEPGNCRRRACGT